LGDDRDLEVPCRRSSRSPGRQPRWGRAGRSLRPRWPPQGCLRLRARRGASLGERTRPRPRRSSVRSEPHHGRRRRLWGGHRRAVAGGDHAARSCTTSAAMFQTRTPHRCTWVRETVRSGLTPRLLLTHHRRGRPRRRRSDRSRQSTRPWNHQPDGLRRDPARLHAHPAGYTGPPDSRQNYGAGWHSESPTDFCRDGPAVCRIIRHARGITLRLPPASICCPRSLARIRALPTKT